jgi:hypothetical protein
MRLSCGLDRDSQHVSMLTIPVDDPVDAPILAILQRRGVTACEKGS